ncbi:MAG: hypothetical protein AAF799_43975 [Myxococcota bacterium]
MRIDLEQFLALTMTLGAVGAVGAGVYTNRASTETVDTTEAESTAEEEEEPMPEAEPRPPRPAEPAPTAAPEPEPTPQLDADPDILDAAPGPQVESMNW